MYKDFKYREENSTICPRNIKPFHRLLIPMVQMPSCKLFICFFPESYKNVDAVAEVNHQVGNRHESGSVLIDVTKGLISFGVTLH